MVEPEVIASDLESLRDGRLSAAAFDARYREQVETSRLLSSVWGGLQHYLADGDIRAKDPRYASMQQGEMSELIRLIRSGAPAADLERISFLTSTRPA